MADIGLHQVGKEYPNGFSAINGVELSIDDGEFMVLVGPSGCGKSTLLRMIAGLEFVSSGEVHIGGDDVTDAAPRDRDIAMVFQGYALYPHMSVAKNIGYPLKLAGVAKSEIAERVRTIAEQLELVDELDRRPSQLSGGQRQRVAMGRALIRRPRVFLMDEPLSNLDAKLRVQMRAEIARLQRSLGVTTVYVTHDQVEAMTMGDRVAVMNAGVIEQCAPPRELYDDPINLFVAEFIGSPKINLFEVVSVGGTAQVRLGDNLIDLIAGHADVLAQQAGGTELVLAIRPESFEVSDVDPDVVLDVDFVEELGSEYVVHGALSESSGRHPCAIRLPFGHFPEPGDRIPIRFDRTRSRLFSGADGTLLTNKAATGATT